MPVASAKSPPRRPTTTALDVIDVQGAIRVIGEDFEVAFSREHGRLSGLTWRGQPVITTGPRLQVWRGATDNDGIKGWSGQAHKPLGRWLAAGLNGLTFAPSTVEVERQDEAILITIRQTASCLAATEAFVHTHSYRIAPDGRIAVRNQFKVDPALLRPAAPGRDHDPG